MIPVRVLLFGRRGLVRIRAPKYLMQSLQEKKAGSIWSDPSPNKEYKSAQIGIKFNKKPYVFKAHRLAWLYMTGKWPEKDIDHINHNPTDNRWENLRPINDKENSKNKKLQPNNKSGFNGVHFQEYNRNDKTYRYWIAQIGLNNEIIYLGSFKNKEGAIQARKEANIKYGFHENHGK